MFRCVGEEASVLHDPVCSWDMLYWYYLYDLRRFSQTFSLVAAFLKPGTAFYTILALGAKLGAAAAFNVTFMYTAQLYPTSIRNSAVGTCSTIARVGGMVRSRTERKRER